MPTLNSQRIKARQLARAHKNDPEQLVREAMAVAKHDEQLAFEIFRAAPKAVAGMTARQVESLLPTLHDWNSTDCFSCFVSGVAWREGAIADRVILGWTRSDNIWTRRASLASTIPLNLPARGATAPKGEAGKTLRICALLVDDRDDMVVKALSWALRVLARKNEPAVRTFVREHESKLAARVLREVRNKITTGLKNPKRSLG